MISPAAQAVLKAWHLAYDGKYIDGEWHTNCRGQIAAALRALADQVVPEIVAEEWRYSSPQRAKILAIAVELEGINE